MSALTDFDLTTFSETVTAWGFPASNARRLCAFYDGSGHVDVAALRIGNKLSERLSAEVPLRQSQVITQHRSADGTTKLLIGFPQAGGAVEAVLMPSHRADRAAGCISSQIGCAMGCDFCASMRGGLVRNLSAGEIVEQFLHLRELAAGEGRRLSTIVFMGMGEPMHNLPNVIAAIRRMCDSTMGNLGWKAVTVSTVGIVPGMDALAAADLNVHLALSLHAPDDQTRSRIVPVNRRWPVAEVMAAARRFLSVTGRIPTIEYCMLDGVNDADWQAETLAELMAGFRAHVNLIPHNWIGEGLSGVTHRPPSAERVARFLKILQERGVVAHLRRQRGDDVAAACGQLRETELAKS